MGEIVAVVLAAGEGKRMKSKNSKVVHKVCGKPLIKWVYEAVKKSGIDSSVFVVGHREDQVRACLGNEVSYAVQEKQLGTGHAVQQAHRYFDEGDGQILVLYGDTPLISAQTIKSAMQYYNEGNYIAVVISAVVDDPSGYGRIIRDAEGRLVKIVEQRDADDAEKAVREINSGMYIFSSKELTEALKLLKNDNDQGEYYLTDTLEIMLSKGYKTGIYKVADSDEILGANDPQQLGQIAEIMEKKSLHTDRH
jgi:bifunctional UDP-N-acetylglucosamine pyrophosphorylase/glucosamine-1-phosphate N-acetyltransferase